MKPALAGGLSAYRAVRSPTAWKSTPGVICAALVIHDRPEYAHFVTVADQAVKRRVHEVN